jgi:hypothetical protein
LASLPYIFPSTLQKNEQKPGRNTRDVVYDKRVLVRDKRYIVHYKRYVVRDKQDVVYDKRYVVRDKRDLVLFFGLAGSFIYLERKICSYISGKIIVSDIYVAAI